MPASIIARTTLLGLLITLLAACAQTGPLDTDIISSAQVLNLSQHDAEIISSGQPTQEQFRVLANAGVRHVINLVPVADMPFDEASLVGSLGMQYHSIPVAGAADITRENARTLFELLESLEGEPVIIHCASSNRVGALIAVSAAQSEGMSVDDAVAKGRAWGLTGLEPAVRTALSGN